MSHSIKATALLVSFIVAMSLLISLASGFELGRHLSLMVKRAASDSHADHKEAHHDDKHGHHDNKHGHHKDTDKHTSMMHSHLSRKVFDRACAASKDTIDEVVACVSKNEHMLKIIKPEVAAKCYQDSFGQEFDPKDIIHHKELICKNREKFEDMTACVYRKTAEALDPKEIDQMTGAMVDVGLCIINALDG